MPLLTHDDFRLAPTAELLALFLRTPLIESEAKDAKQKTLHYEYRQAVGDTRNWGSPWNIFLEPAKLSKKGGVLTEKTFVVSGELIEADAEKFVREKLGLPAEEVKTNKTTSQTIEACESEKKIANFVKP